MKSYLVLFLCFFLFLSANASDKDSTIYYSLPDSIKAVQFMAEIKVGSFVKKKYCLAGIKTDAVKLGLQNYYGKKGFSFHSNAEINNIKHGVNVGFDLANRDLTFDYDWEINETYKLLIAEATDSAGNFSLYSGYVFLPKENKWKLIGSVKLGNRWNSIQQPAFFYVNGKKQDISVSTGQVWVQRNTGSWKNLKEDNQPSPIINLFGHLDSVVQRKIDMDKIGRAIQYKRTDVRSNVDGLYYLIINEGSGKQVDVNDTVTVNYRVTLFEDTAIIDQSKDKPAIFPLKRLIKGWQIGVPLLKVGGKIKLVIPSDLAYSIRTRSAKIPPNSILEFEIEVLDAKSPQ